MEEADRIERERPAREAAEQLQQSAVELGRLTREMIANGEDPDGAYVAPEVAGTQITVDEARQFNAVEAQKFMANTPEFYRSDPNVTALFDYLDRNGLQIVTAEMFRRAFERLRDYGLLQERPPEPTPEPRVVETEPVTAPELEETFVGIDPRNGREKIFNRTEVDNLSADEFKVWFIGPHRTPKVADILTRR